MTKKTIVSVWGLLVLSVLFAGCVLYFFPEIKAEWVSAIGTAISALFSIASVIAIVLVFKQLEQNQHMIELSTDELKQTKIIAQLQFEDTLEKEYRDLAARIPTDALIGGVLSPRQYKAAFDEIFRYFDLSNKQVMLRKQERIGDSTWKNWQSGIKFNLSLPAFRKAWIDIKEKTDSQKSEFFSELRKLEETNFQCDPKSWK